MDGDIKKKDRFAKTMEFITKCNFIGSGLEKTINDIFLNIYYHENIHVAFDELNNQSSSFLHSKSLIRINIKDNPGRQIRYIWNLLHEYGHYLSGDRLMGYTELDELAREEEAWENALKEIQKYPILLNEINDFNYHKEFCLKNYRLKHIDLKNKLGL
jgi:hypothetical protein